MVDKLGKLLSIAYIIYLIGVNPPQTLSGASNKKIFKALP